MASGGASNVDALECWLAGDGLMALDGILVDALDIVGVLDRELRIRYLSRTVPGLTREPLYGQSVLVLVPPEQQQEALDVYTRVLNTGVGERYVTVYKDGDDVLLWEVRAAPLRVGEGVVGLTVITTDVTEQRRAAVDRDRFFSLSLDMLIVASPDGLLKRINPSFCTTLGYEATALVGSPFVDLVHPEDRARTRDVFDDVLRGTPVANFENRYLRVDGEQRVFSWRANVDPITRDVYAVARDVTQQRVVEAQLRHSQKMEAIGQLAGGIAHDFNNLLLAILGNVELAKHGNLSESELGEHLGEIEGSARRAADLTQQLLAFSRAQPLNPVLVDLNQLVGGLMKMLRRLLPESIAIDWRPGQNLPSVNADPGQLEQVVVNLCVNARDAMVEGGRLTIGTDTTVFDETHLESHPWATPGRYVLLRVADTGAGMAPEVRERAFEPFFTTKGAQRGTGLGLATVYGIVQRHAGMVHLYSELGHGTVLEVYLPADSRSAPQVAPAVESVPPLGDETILIAEDEEQVRRVVVRLLERAGYRTIAVANGMEALRVLRDGTEAVHLALLDVIMPGLGGPETWEKLRELRPSLRVLFASGYADERQRERLPADAVVLDKPFRMEELLRAVRKRLDEPSG